MAHPTDTRTRTRSRGPRRSACPQTGKVRYRDPREATNALQYLRNRARIAEETGGEHTIRVSRKYHCVECHGWHLTSWASAGGPGDLVGLAA